MCRNGNDEQSHQLPPVIERKFTANPLADDVVRRAYDILDASCQFHGRCESFAIVHSEGLLTVAGCVPSYYLKQMLQELLKGVDGVRCVENHVDVIGIDELSSARDGNEASR
jgi:hypothetical protein